MQYNTQNSNKAERAELALRHVQRMDKVYAAGIAESVQHSVIYSGAAEPFRGASAGYTECVMDADSVSAAFSQEAGKHMAILNFASYHHPGGGFLRGSKAQEEALCHESALYNILHNFGDYYEYNEHHKNKALYTDRAIFSPDVVFEHGRKMRKISVLTCAAPNFSAASQNYRITKDENSRALRNRIRFILDILSAQSVEVAILGAFGCGVFGQNPAEVAQCFKEEASRTSWSKPIRLIYAIPRGRRDNNLQEFQKVFRK